MRRDWYLTETFRRGSEMSACQYYHTLRINPSNNAITASTIRI